MKYPLLALALSATPALAGRKAAASKPKLTSDESDCKVFGEFFETVGKARDLLIPITTVIGDIRKDGKDANVEDIVRHVHDAYAHPEITPEKLRSFVELECLNERHLGNIRKTLSKDERGCQFLSNTLFWIATDRDALIPITTTITKARNYAARVAPNNPALAEAMVIVVGGVYARSTTSPAQLRYLEELRCMQPPKADATATDAGRPWR